MRRNISYPKLDDDIHGPKPVLSLYTYNEDGTNRRENITDWALTQFQTRYQDDSITKWDIFHYNYDLLHHPITAIGIRKTSSGIYPISLSPKTSGDLPTLARGWQTFTSTTNRSPNTRNSIRLKPQECKWIWP